jgi:predicted Zn-dependent peptidase
MVSKVKELHSVFIDLCQFSPNRPTPQYLKLSEGLGRYWVACLGVFLAVYLASGCCVHGVMAAPVTMEPTSMIGLRVADGLSPTQDSQSIQPYLDRVSRQISQFTLPNGIHFIVMERHQAPVISFLTYVDVGGVDEPDGQTGVAHFFEHLAFKGTRRIGTRDYGAEKKLLDQLDSLSDRIALAKKSGQTDKVKDLTSQFEQINGKAARLTVQNEYGRIVEQSGGVGMNATTSAEATRYFYSFPSNKLELWMSLESERFLEPVFREFYEEKEVILEERRTRSENSPIGQMMEAFLQTAFTVHPYGRPVIGYTDDIRNLTRQDLQRFFATHYIPSQLTMVLVGDVNPSTVQRLATLYFGRYQSKTAVPPLNIIEPPQKEPKEVILKLPSQPWYLEGYRRPSRRDPDHVVYELMGRILSDGRTSRLYQSLVEQQKVSLAAQGFSGFPGDKYPNLMLFYSLTAPGKTVAEVAHSLEVEINRLKTELVSSDELERVKKQAKAKLLQSLDSNMGMAQLLAEYQVKTGDWHNVFTELDKIVAVTPLDIQRVAMSTFRPENRTVGKIVTLP